MAPFAGRVVRKAREVGEWVGEGEAIAELVSLEELESRLDLPEALAVGVTEGSTPVRVRVRALNADLAGTISSVVPDVDTRSRLVPVRVLLTNAEGRLRPGMSVTGLVGTGLQAPSLTIHKDAILRDDAGGFIYWSPAGSAIPARIRTLFAYRRPRGGVRPYPPGRQRHREGQRARLSRPARDRPLSPRHRARGPRRHRPHWRRAPRQAGRHARARRRPLTTDRVPAILPSPFAGLPGSPGRTSGAHSSVG